MYKRSKKDLPFIEGQNNIAKSLEKKGLTIYPQMDI